MKLKIRCVASSSFDIFLNSSALSSQIPTCRLNYDIIFLDYQIKMSRNTASIGFVLPNPEKKTDRKGNYSFGL